MEVWWISPSASIEGSWYTDTRVGATIPCNVPDKLPLVSNPGGVQEKLGTWNFGGSLPAVRSKVLFGTMMENPGERYQLARPGSAAIHSGLTAVCQDFLRC